MRNEEEVRKVFDEFNKYFCDVELVIMEVIENILKCLIV